MQRTEGMEVFLDIVREGNVRIELSVYDHEGCSVIFTVTDDEDRRILRSSVMENGRIKIYPTAEKAMSDALRMFTSQSASPPEHSDKIAH